MGDIKLNDQIFDESGNLTTVVGIYPQGDKDIYKVTFADGSTVKCGYEHL
jgi:twinkle protein